MTRRALSGHAGRAARFRARLPSSAGGRAALYRLAAQHGLFGITPVLFTAFFVLVAIRQQVFAFDFHREYWPAGDRVLHNLSPYDPRAQDLANDVAFPYPALAALVFAPLALIPLGAAEIIFTALSAAALLEALRLLEVRDWRLYGVVWFWPPVVTGWQNANVTLLLLLGLALIWRYRYRPALNGILVALLISVKPLVWPLCLWLLATRRYAALGWAFVGGVAINALAWSILGFQAVPQYFRLLRAVASHEQDRGYSLASFAVRHGISRVDAYALGLLVAAIVAAACLWAGWHGGERSALVLAVGLILVASPILWTHYYALLIVPLAVARPRLSPLWALPLVMFVCPETPPDLWPHALALAVLGSILVVVWRRPGADDPLDAPSNSDLPLVVGSNS